MIKTQTKEENKFMKRILPHYYQFLTENPFSMLVQILGNGSFVFRFFELTRFLLFCRNAQSKNVSFTSQSSLCHHGQCI
jgi:hypothetical protein